MRYRFLLGWLACWLLAIGVLSGAVQAQSSGGAQQEIQRQQSQPGNNAPVWRDVRGGGHAYQTTQARGVEASVLIQSGGETWRQTRRVFTFYGGWLLLIVPTLIGLFYMIKGAMKLKGKPTGRAIQRFVSWERMVHWTVAITFCVLALSGLIMMFGKYVLMPVFGRTLFSWLAILSKNLHNFVGPVFAVALLLMILTFIKDNIFRTHDLQWIKKFGGMLSGEHVPSGRFNAGEKVWFWGGVLVLGVAVSMTGFILDFPNFAQGRTLMQQANVIHAVGAILYIAMSLGHIYMGTIGMEGAYRAMRDGTVDETWAREHHELWYNEAARKTPAASRAGFSVPPVKEGLSS